MNPGRLRLIRLTNRHTNSFVVGNRIGLSLRMNNFPGSSLCSYTYTDLRRRLPDSPPRAGMTTPHAKQGDNPTAPDFSLIVLIVSVRAISSPRSAASSAVSIRRLKFDVSGQNPVSTRHEVCLSYSRRGTFSTACYEERHSPTLSAGET